MDLKDYYYTCLNEEAGEIVQAVCKCKRFGENSKFTVDGFSNIENLSKEINDLIAVVELLQEEGVSFEKLFDREEIEKKKKRVKYWLTYEG